MSNVGKYLQEMLNEGKKTGMPKQPGVKTLKEKREPVTAKDENGKKFRVYDISANWVALIPVKGEVSDKIKVPIGDFYEFYTHYDNKGKVIHTPEDITEARIPKCNQKRPGESNKEALERIGKQNDKKGPQIRNTKEYK